MFLSTRWGKPSYEIKTMPLSEFTKQKLFWEHHIWGITDDLIAQGNVNYLFSKSLGKVNMPVTDMKQLAVYKGAIKAFIIEPVSMIRRAFMGIAKAIKGGK